MKITVLTLFPEFFSSITENTIIKRAVSKNLVELEFVNIRDFSTDRHKRVDSAPIGGGAGLVMKCQPIYDALNTCKSPSSFVISTNPKGKVYNQQIAEMLSKKEHLVIICGHYEGIDERINNYVDMNISLGDFILTGGEIASSAIIDSVVRILDGVLSRESIIDESFENNLLEYPQYTEPYDFKGYKVPDILYSGNHNDIDKFRYMMALKTTLQYRPDLIDYKALSEYEKELINESLDAERITKYKK